MSTTGDEGGFRELFDDFARTEHIEIVKERKQLQLLAIGIGGTVLPILISLLSLRSAEPAIGLLLTWLSFIYFLLGLRYTAAGRRHEELLHHLTEHHPKLAGYLGRPRLPETASTISRAWKRVVWLIVNSMIFIFPGLICIGTAFFILPDMPAGIYTLFFWFLFVVVDALLLVAICINWWRGWKEGKKLDLLASGTKTSRSQPAPEARA